MYIFPEKLYTDVRIEDVFQTDIRYSMENLEQSRVRSYKAAFIRVFDGSRWYYSSTSDIANIQNEIDNLAIIAKPNDSINENPIVKKFEINTGEYIKFKEESVRDINKQQKLDILKPYFELVKRPTIKSFLFWYKDISIIKTIYSSKGTNIIYDTQVMGFGIGYTMTSGDRKLNDGRSYTECYMRDLINKEEEVSKYMEKCEEYLHNYKEIKPGKYPVILSPIVAGVFAHESFGHKSEADFMIGDEIMLKEWEIGKRVGADILSIVDDGNEFGTGYVPFDDEGTKARTTYLIKEGILSGRLHSANSAASLNEELTGNGRAVSFEYEPIVRMTSTYILPGDKTKEQLIEEIKEGVLIETTSGGTGLSDFTLKPVRSYMIRDGKIAEPVSISVVTGNVMETLYQIDGLSNELEIKNSISGGCGKGEQYPLLVSLGGPYVRVKKMDVR